MVKKELIAFFCLDIDSNIKDLVITFENSENNSFIREVIEEYIIDTFGFKKSQERDINGIIDYLFGYNVYCKDGIEIWFENINAFLLWFIVELIKLLIAKN